MQLFFFSIYCNKKNAFRIRCKSPHSEKKFDTQAFCFLDDIKMKVLSQLLELLVNALSVLNVL